MADRARARGRSRDRDLHLARRLAVLRALPDAYVVTDPSGRIVDVNDAWCEMTGQPSDRAIGASPPYPWWPDDPDERAARMARIEHSIATGSGDWEMDLADPGGRVHHIRFTTSELVDDEGQRVGFLSILRDQTEQVRAESRLRTIQRLADDLAGALELQQVAAAILHEAVPALGADAGSVGLLVGDDRIHVLETDIDAVVGPGDVVALEDRPFIARAIRSRHLVAIEDERDFESYDPVVAERMANLGMRSALLIPLVGSERVLGLLGVAFREPRKLDPADRELCTAIAAQCSLAIERAQRFEHERTVATTLQESFLDTEPLVLPGVEVVVRYQPAVDEMEVGGDWYDVVALPGERVGVAVGDVVGRGLAAAAVMGQVRSAMRALALTSDHPADILSGLDRFARHTPAAQVATVAYAVLEPKRQRLRYASAGHVPPMLVAADGTVRALDDGTSWPLDTRADQARFEAEVEFVPGASLVLYTDGLVERRGESIDVGLARLERLLAELSGQLPPRAWCDVLMTRLAGDQPARDDVALLCLHAETVGPTFRATFPPDVEQLRPLRADLRAWLEPLGAAPSTVEDIVLAASEACANAIEHPTPAHAPPLVTVEGLAAGEEVILTVSDRGRWIDTAPDPDRGRGVPLMRAVMDDVEIRSRPDGTAVVLRRRVVP